MAERTNDGPLSIQGEHARDAAAPLLMDLAEVDTYVDGVSDEVLACRERGRHIFPTIRQAGMVFVDVTEEGLLVRPLLCTCCRLARRLELWDTAGRGQATRYVPVSASIEYLRGSNGERRPSRLPDPRYGATLTVLRLSAAATGSSPFPPG